MEKSNSKASSLSELPKEIVEVASKVGMEKTEDKRSASFIHLDYETILAAVNELFKGKVEIMDIKNALKKYDWLKNYYSRLVPPEKDKYTVRAEEELHGGYFIRALPGAKVEFPVQACLMIARKTFTQNIHNIVIAEENSSINVLTGCITHRIVDEALHIGITEFYVKKNAKLNFTMVHSWKRGVTVRPRSAALIEDKGIFISNYVCLNPVENVQMYPAAYCLGENSIARFNNIIYAREGSNLDLGSRAELSSPKSKSEIISRIVAEKGSKVTARGMIIGEASNVKGHLECRGLLLDDYSEIHAIPELIGRRKGVDLSHEAAVGKIAEKELVYLMARGLSQEEAVSTIVRGFLDVELMELPEALTKEIRKLVNQLTQGI
jgi:hypothetical protein